MSRPDPKNEEAFQVRLSRMREIELLDFLRDAAIRIESATSRLEALVKQREAGSDAGENTN